MKKLEGLLNVNVQLFARRPGDASDSVREGGQESVAGGCRSRTTSRWHVGEGKVRTQRDNLFEWVFLRAKVHIFSAFFASYRRILSPDILCRWPSDHQELEGDCGSSTGAALKSWRTWQGLATTLTLAPARAGLHKHLYLISCIKSLFLKSRSLQEALEGTPN